MLENRLLYNIKNILAMEHDPKLSSKGDEMNIWVGGKYRMIKKLGEGAFGEIFLGENMTSKKKVAIKVVCETRKRLEFRRTTNQEITCSC